MPGGQRQGAGRKSTWASGAGRQDTRSIRIPKNIANKLMDIAHHLDAGGEVNLDYVTQSIKDENRELRAEVDRLEEIIAIQKREILHQPTNQNVDIEKLKEEALEVLYERKQSSPYKKAKKVLNQFTTLLQQKGVLQPD